MSERMGRDEWMAEMERLNVDMGDDGMTRSEIAKQVGRAPGWVSEHILQPGVAAGGIAVGSRNMPDVSGRSSRRPVYRIIKK